MNKIVHHQREIYKNYNYCTVSGVLCFLGFLMLIAAKNLPLRLVLFATFLGMAYIFFKMLKTSKPITISDKSIELGKMVIGFKAQIIAIDRINSISLTHITKVEYLPRMALATGNREVEAHSYFYQLKLDNGDVLKFDNEYDDRLKEDLKQLCLKNGIDINLDVSKKVTAYNKS